MTMNNEKRQVMKTHYVWDEWKIEYRKGLRNRIKNATESGRIEIAHHMALEYPFLLKRQLHKGFRNLIFYKILHNKSIYREVIQMITELISKNIMYKDDIDDVLSSAAPRAELKMPNISDEEIIEIDAKNRENRITYLRNKLANSLKDGDIEASIIIEAEINELINYNLTLQLKIFNFKL